MIKNKLVFAVVYFLYCSFTSFAQQPIKGPGGTESYEHASFDSAYYNGGSILNQFWLFEPANPKPDSAFVVTYWHGSYNGNVGTIGSVLSSYIKEIVRKGYTVVVPQYQYGSYNPSDAEKILMFSSITGAAFAELQKPGHVHPKVGSNGKVIYGTIGYSLGGMIFSGANNVATYGLIDYPKAIVGFAPYGASTYTPYSNLPTTTKVSIQIGESDNNSAGGGLQYQAKTMHWNAISHIPCENKIVLTVKNLEALPAADHLYHDMSMVNAYDYYASWKYSIGMMDCAMKNKNCAYVLTNRDSIAYMGKRPTGYNYTSLKIEDGACSATGVGVFATNMAISVTGAKIISTPGGNLSLITQTIPSNANKLVDWKINDSTLASISANGILTAKQNGSIVITATLKQNPLYVSVITVTATNQYISATSVGISLVDANSFEPITDYILTDNSPNVVLQVSKSPMNADIIATYWNTNPNGIVEISADGEITKVGTGVVTITGTFVSTNTFTSSLVVTVNGSTTQLTDYSKSTFSVFPNPAKTSISIQSTSSTFNSPFVIVVDIHGNIWIQKSISKTTHSLQVDISAFPSGMYFVLIGNDRLKFSIHR